VGRIEVARGPDLPADRVERYEKLEGDRLIREAIEAELTKAGAWQPGGDVAIAVTVKTFRLRSGANAFWNGFFAGSDLLEGQIEMRRADAAPERITFKFSGNEDEYLKLSARARFRSLARALGREIRDHLAAP
jgi:hypothetical protein